MIRVVIISTLFYILSPLLLLFFSSLWLYRFFLSIWKEIFYPRFGPFFNGLDAFLLGQCPYSGEQLLNVGVYFTVAGRLELDEFRTIVETKLFNRLQNNDKSYRRLVQKFTTWAGFSCGEDEINFKVADHVRLLNLEELGERLKRQCVALDLAGTNIIVEKKIHQEHFTRQDVDELNRALLRVPFQENKSPWEILLLHNPKSESGSKSKFSGCSQDESFENGTTVLFLRINHSISDGIGILSLFSHFFDQSQEEVIGRTLGLFSGSDSDSDSDYDSDGNRNNKSQSQSQSQIHNAFSKARQYFNLENLVNFVLGVPAFVSYLLNCVKDDWPPITLKEKHPRSFYTFSYEIPKDKINQIQQSAATASSERGKDSPNPNANAKVKSTTVMLAAFALGVEKYFKDHLKFGATVLPQNIATTFGGTRRRNELTNSL